MGLRNLAKRKLGVVRRSADYHPWLTRSHLRCALVLSLTVSGERINPDLYVTLSDGEAHTAIHGGGEFGVRYALRGRLLPAAA